MDSLTYEYGSDNRLLTLQENASSTTSDYTYDDNGNIVSIQEDGANKFRTMHYENRNLPVFMELDDFTDIIYLYNAEGQRIFKKVDKDTAEHYIMDGSQNVGLFTENSSLTYWNIVANGTMGRLKANGDKLFYIKDHLGSTRVVVNTAGNILEILDYYPFGLIMSREPFGPFEKTKEQFTGKELNAETGWHHLGARPYDAIIGRFPIVDPLANHSPGWSPYNYTKNNPINHFDPTGLQEEEAKEEKKEKSFFEILVEFLKAQFPDIDIKIIEEPPTHVDPKPIAKEVGKVFGEGEEVNKAVDAIVLGKKTGQPPTPDPKRIIAHNIINENKEPPFANDAKVGKYEGKKGWYDNKGRFISKGDKPGEWHVYPNRKTKNPKWNGQKPRRIWMATAMAIRPMRRLPAVQGRIYDSNMTAGATCVLSKTPTCAKGVMTWYSTNMTASTARPRWVWPNPMRPFQPGAI